MPDAKKRSVIKRPSYEESPSGGWILSLASFAEEFPSWGADPAGLDLKLREFWPTESYLQSAIYAIATRNAAFSWTLQGPPSTVEACQEFLVENWVDFCYKWNLDYLTQNNGAFVEIIRLTDSPDSPCIGINQLDAARCRRTGVDEWPVVYSDRLGGQHRLAPHQVCVMADMPSPIETMNSVGMCAVYRILCEAKRMRDISVYEREKLSGFNPKSLYIVGNVGKTQLTDVLKEHEQNQMQKGYVRYVKPAIMGVLDPKAPATVATLDFASIPDGFDKDKELKWYITVMALALGCDYQDLAPLSAGNLGTSTQSEVLHLKSKGKGPAMYMKRISHMMNFSGILPKNVTFEFDEKDIEDDTKLANLDILRASQRQVYIGAGVLSKASVRQQMLDSGEINQEIFDMMAKEDIGAGRQQQDITSGVTTEDEIPSQPEGGNSSPVTGDEDRPNPESEAKVWCRFCHRMIRASEFDNHMRNYHGQKGGEKQAKQEFAAKLRAKLEKRMADQMAVTLKKVGNLFTKPLQEMKGMKGGEGSGNFEHEGRPGEVGGSGPGGGSGVGGILSGSRDDNKPYEPSAAMVKNEEIVRTAIGKIPDSEIKTEIKQGNTWALHYSKPDVKSKWDDGRVHIYAAFQDEKRVGLEQNIGLYRQPGERPPSLIHYMQTWVKEGTLK